MPVCSPWHALVNGSFIVLGLLLVLGAWSARAHVPRPGWAMVGVIAWTVAGLSSIGTGLTPLDQLPELHVLASTPVSFFQPLALLAAALSWRGVRPGLARAAAGAGALSLLGTVAFFLTSTQPGLGGLWERVSLWPAYLWLGVLGLVLLRGRDPSASRRP